MTRKLLLLLLFHVTSFTGLTAQTGRDKEWELVFHDEFNQKNGTLPDPTYWSTCPTNPRAVWASFIVSSPKVAFVRNNMLVLRCLPKPKRGRRSKEMISGAIETRGKFSFLYGRIEARIRTNPHRGNFPAFWMKPEKCPEGSPSCGEIDIFESFDTQQRSAHTVHNHWTYVLGHKDSPQHTHDEKLDPSEWHIYGLEWDAREIRWYVDGRLVHRYKKSSDSQAVQQGQWPFDRDFYIILNQSCRNEPDRDLYDPKHTYETLVDWVRVYKRR